MALLPVRVVTAYRHFRDWSRDKGDEHELAPGVFYVSFMRYVSRRLGICQECRKVSDDVHLRIVSCVSSLVVSFISSQFDVGPVYDPIGTYYRIV